MRDRRTEFDRCLERFPPPVRERLSALPQNGGRLDARDCMTVARQADMSTDDLMVALLPVAALFALVPISGFRVGAVAKARLPGGADEFALFAGANAEFEGQALTQAVHAEQAAVVNAWLQGAVAIDTIAVTASPCGHCRQFLQELATRGPLTIIMKRPDGRGCTRTRLADLLPQAFGPRDLAVPAGLMSPQRHPPQLDLMTAADDPLVLAALAAAGHSYAPYTHNLAGCTIQAGDQKIHTGSYAETAAFNPSLSPLHTAIIRWNMDGLGTNRSIIRAVLVERRTTISQRGIAQLLLAALAPGIPLEYYEAR